jgi:hypothetical protein
MMEKRIDLSFEWYLKMRIALSLTTHSDIVGG